MPDVVNSGLVREPEGGAAAAVHVRARHLVKRFGQFTALADVSLDVVQGELVCLLGPSGCGKTTMLRVIAGLDAQDAGTIEIAGRDVSRAPPAARDFGIVFQSYALFPNLTVADNVGYGLVNRRVPRSEIDRRVAELLEMVGLPEQGSKYPAQLSGGQQQRVALARALAPGPALLLLDEPLSALDARVRVRLREEIKDLQRRLGVTTILVTHDQEEALSMGNRVVVMNAGRIEQVGTPQQIYAEPASAFVADFVGSMNLIDAISSGAGSVRVGGLTFGVANSALAGPIRLGIRPESLMIGKGAAGVPLNRFAAVVVALDFRGSYARATLIPDAAPHLRLLADFASDVLAMQELHPGARVEAAVSPDALLIFPNLARGGT